VKIAAWFGGGDVGSTVEARSYRR